ncbi:MAG: hypothetical protein JWR16_3392, partial [Nevskia sp.]|nr:hypothetical protein [Nevskia sp.]
MTIGKSELEFNLLAPLFDEQQAEELQIVGAHYASALR